MRKLSIAAAAFALALAGAAQADKDATTTTATATATTSLSSLDKAATISSRLRFVNGQIASAKVFAIKSLDSCCCFLGGCHFDKSKAA